MRREGEHVLAAVVLSLAVMLPFSGVEAQTATPKKVYEFKLQSHSPATNKMYQVAMYTAKILEERSHGQIKIKGYPSSQLAPASGALEACGKGLIDILVSGSGYFAGKCAPGTFSQIPYLLPSDFALAEMWWGTDLGTVVSKSYEKKTNTLVLSPHQCGAYVYFFRRGVTVHKFSDLKGLKVKITGGVAGVPEKIWGLVPLSITMGEIYEALNRSIVDAASLPIHTLESYKLMDVCGQVLLPALTEVGANYTWWNVDSFHRLPPDLQKLTREVYRETWARNSTLWLEDDKTIIPRLRAKMEFYTLPEADVKAMRQPVVAPAWDFLIKQCEGQGLGPEAKAIKSLFDQKQITRLFEKHKTTTGMWGL